MCSELIDENGIGDCRQRDTLFDGKFSCFVNDTSSCNDKVIQPDGLYRSAIACENKNDG